MPLGAGNPASANDIVNVLAAGLDPAVPANPGRLQVTVSGISMPVLQITPLPNGQYQIQIILTQSFAGAQVPLMVSVDGSSSAPFVITVR